MRIKSTNNTNIPTQCKYIGNIEFERSDEPQDNECTQINKTHNKQKYFKKCNNNKQKLL